MSWITLDNLKRFWKGLRTNPITFTGEIDLQNTTRYKGNEIATKADVEAGEPDLTPYMKKTADSNLGMGEYSINFPWATISSTMFNSAPMLIIKQTGRGVNVNGNLLIKGAHVATEDYVDIATANVAKWKEAYNALKVRSYPTQFDNDELTALTSEPINLASNTTGISLAQPYTIFDGLLFEVTDGGEMGGEHFGLTHIYISTAELNTRVQRIVEIFNKTNPSDVPLGVELFCNGQRFLYVFVGMNGSIGTLGETQWSVAEGQGIIERIYGVRFKQIK